MIDVYDSNLSKILDSSLKNLAPPEKITMSKWVEKNIILSSISSRFAGRWSNSMTPWLVEPMDCMSPNSGYNHVVLCFASQLGKTAILINGICYYIDIDPGPIMWFLPSDSQAKHFSKTKLSPILQNCEPIKRNFAERSRDKDNTIMSKNFSGGSLVLSGAGSPTNMAGSSIKFLLRDEADRWKDDVGGEGDGLSITEQRTATYEDNRMIVDTSTPTIKGESAIERQFNISDQRHWYVPCPHCGEYQEMLFSRTLDGDEKPTRMLDFTRNKAGKITNVVFICYKCGCAIEQKDKPAMQNEGKYIAHNPGAEIAGFFANGLNSMFMSWERIGARFFQAKNNYLKLKSFVNLVLGECWEDPSTYISPYSIQNRSEDYKKVPKEVIFITCGVDIQHNRLELEVRGWGVDYESWGIEYKVIDGYYDNIDTWRALQDYLDTPFDREDGIKQKIYSTFLDTADGTTQKQAYSFCRANKTKAVGKVYAIRGRGGDNMNILHKITQDTTKRLTHITLGTDTIKDLCNYNLQIKEVGKNYVHFPKGFGYTKDYYNQLTSEEKVEEINKKTRKVKRVWRKKNTTIRNEAWDVFCYNRACIEYLTNKNFDWSRYEGKIYGKIRETPVKKRTKNNKKNNGISV